MSRFEDLNAMFIHELKDVASAESQQVAALSKLAEAASDDDLTKALQDHLDVTKSHSEKVIDILASLDSASGGVTCEGMKGILDECNTIVDDAKQDSLRDAWLIASVQKAKHYEISTYGALRSWARALGHNDAADTFDEIAKQEGEADKRFIKLAEQINPKAKEATAGVA